MQSKHLVLVRHGPTSATNRGAFGADEPLYDPENIALAAPLPVTVHAVYSSPARRCRETAEALGLTATIDPLLRECWFGRWEGKTFDELPQEEVDEWLADPAYDGHGGESLKTFYSRVAEWLSAVDHGVTVAITHSGVIRAAKLYARGLPLTDFWALERPAPLAVVDLSL